jgi:hypothetical protein
LGVRPDDELEWFAKEAVALDEALEAACAHLVVRLKRVGKKERIAFLERVIKHGKAEGRADGEIENAKTALMLIRKQKAVRERA